jgi:hypothetical protein
MKILAFIEIYNFVIQTFFISNHFDAQILDPRYTMGHSAKTKKKTLGKGVCREPRSTNFGWQTTEGHLSGTLQMSVLCHI